MYSQTLGIRVFKSESPFVDAPAPHDLDTEKRRLGAEIFTSFACEGASIADLRVSQSTLLSIRRSRTPIELFQLAFQIRQTFPSARILCRVARNWKGVATRWKQ